MIRLAPLVLLLAACTVSPPAPEADPAAPYRLVAYVYGGSPEAIARISAERLTHVNYAFANLTPEGEVVLEEDRDAANLAALVALRDRNPGLKVLLAVGGWGWSDHFSDVAFTEAGRARFAETALALVRTHRLDGVDVDWEYPGQPGAGNPHRPEDRETFTLLLAETRAALDAASEADGRLDDPYQLTIAAAAGQRFLDHTDMAAVQRSLDFVNLMTYDFYGSWSERTGHHAALHASAPGEPSASGAVELILAAGVPAEKVVLGAAFYGYRWEGVTPEAGGLGQTFTGDADALGHGELVALDDAFERRWDPEAGASWLWNADTRTFISYEDTASVRRKAEYVAARGLGGLMWWQHLHDPDEALLDVAAGVLRSPPRP